MKWQEGRLSRTATIAILALVAIGAGFLIANGMVLAVLAATGMLIGVLAVQRCLMEPISGYYLVIFIAFFSEYPGRLLNKQLPITTFLELLVLFLFIGTYWHARKDKNQSGNLLRYSVSILLIIYILYYIIELFNPNMTNPVGWLFNSKRVLVEILFFAISYRLINTPDRFRYFIKFWIVMSLIAALYGCYQQWFGLLPMELNSLDEHEYGILFQGGVVRKFSFLEGVGTFGSLCGTMAVLTIILAINEKNRKRKYQLALISIFLFLGMAYSGTRTFTLMIPAGLSLYILMTLKNKTTIATIFMLLLGLMFVFFAPINNPILNRMRSTLNTKDESFSVRNLNRKSIQPYIYKHPIGGGVNASGVEGMRFNPNHPLAGFPPDSQLLKLALDMGWIGLAVTMLLFLIVLYQAIHYYFRMKNEEYRNYTIGCICAIFALLITLYSQVTIGQFPTILFIFGMMSLFKRLMEFDEKEQKANPQFRVSSG